MTFGSQGRVLGEKPPCQRRIGTLMPQHGLGAATQEADRGPTRIGGDEGGVSGKARTVVVAAQDRPFDELARDWITDRLLDLGRLRALSLAGEGDRALD